MTDNRTLLHIRQDVGNGNPIVLLHGMFGDATQWEKITEILKSDYRVITVDLLGHGKSPRPKDATYSAHEHTNALRATLESIDATQNLTVLGYSMGGAVALSYCAQYPAGVEQLFLISTPFYLTTDQMISARYAGAVIMTKVSTWLFAKIEAHMHSGKALEKAVHYSNNSKLFHKMIGAYDNHLEAEIIRKNLNQLVHTFDFASALGKIRIPVTYYTGKKDLFVVQGQLNALKQFCPNMDIQRLDVIKVDHMLVQNLPHEIAGLITKNRERYLHIGKDMGSGETIVLVHGIESSSDYWYSLVPALAERYRVIAIDLLGFGKSPKPLNIGYTLSDQITWLKRTLDAHGIHTFQLVGHSLGSLVSLAYAAKHPHGVEGVTLLSPVFAQEPKKSKNFIINKLKYFNNFTDSSFVYAQAARAIGDKYMKRYIPMLRSVENAVNKQNITALARKVSNIPTTVIYGENDALIDESAVRKVGKIITQSNIIKLGGVSHNFALFAPKSVLDIFSDGKPFRHTPKPANIMPPSFGRQLVRLATPILWLKSVSYIIFGLLLFTDAMPALLTIGLAGYVIYAGYKMIRGAFSLRNENLSYIGYILLGLFGVAIGYALIKRPELSVTVSVVAVCVLAVTTGLARMFVAILWTRSKKLKNTLLTSGALMVLVGATAFLGSTVSIYIIIYLLAGLIILRGVRFGVYATVAFVMAYVRGFSKS